MTPSDPRYPIGPFESVGRPLTAEERARKIDAIAEAPAAIRAAVTGLDDHQLDTPYREDGWTVRQVVHHLVDSHVNAYIRFKLAVTEDTPTICTYQEPAWAELPDARDAPIGGSLDILDPLHRRWVSFLHDLEADDFRRPVRHPEMGEIDVDLLLENYAWHGAHHVAHVTSLREERGW